MEKSQTPAVFRAQASRPRYCLEPQQIAMIEEALTVLGDYGEVRLIVEMGRLRFLVTQASYDVLKWRPGMIER